MRRASRKRLSEWAVTLPSLAWLLIFFVVPTAIVVAMAFRPSDPYGSIGQGWTLRTWAELGNPIYPRIFCRTLWLSAVSTVLCLLLGLPTGYYLARSDRRWRQVLMVLVVVPFWTNFLIRILAWKVLLHPEGALHEALVRLHLLSPASTLMYRPEAVLLVLVYTYLPFAILPIYAAAERFDFGLIEAARDLGASQFQAFVRVFLPGIRRGLVTATLVVFIPALGSYIIPDIVGGPTCEMIGNKIAQRTFVDRNLPHASALSALLTLAVLLPMTVWLAAYRRPGTVAAAPTPAGGAAAAGRERPGSSGGARA